MSDEPTTKPERQTDGIIQCPACNGPLVAMETPDDAPVYECRQGHRYTLEALFGAHAEMVGQALSSAVNLMEEQAMLARQMAEQWRTQRQPRLAERYDRDAATADRNAKVIRELLEAGSAP